MRSPCRAGNEVRRTRISPGFYAAYRPGQPTSHDRTPRLQKRLSVHKPRNAPARKPRLAFFFARVPPRVSANGAIPPPSPDAMARTRRATAADPKHDTTDSREQLKNTRSTREGRTGPLRAKRARSKKTGRLDEVDHDRLKVARSVRPEVALAAPRAVEVVETSSRPTNETADDVEHEGFSLRAVSRDGKRVEHDTPPRMRRAVSPTPRPSSPSAGQPLVPRAIAPRAAAAVAAAPAVGVASPVSAPVIKVRAADFPGASEFRAPPA